MRPTLDGLNADQWFTVARALATLTLLCLLLWFVGRLVRRGVRFIADHRRAERERRRANEHWLNEARRRSETPRNYLRERGHGAGCVDG